MHLGLEPSGRSNCMDSLHLFLLSAHLPTSPGYSNLSRTNKPRNPASPPCGQGCPFSSGLQCFPILGSCSYTPHPEVVQYNCPPFVSPTLLILQAWKGREEEKPLLLREITSLCFSSPLASYWALALHASQGGKLNTHSLWKSNLHSTCQRSIITVGPGRPPPNASWFMIERQP